MYFGRKKYGLLAVSMAAMLAFGMVAGAVGAGEDGSTSADGKEGVDSYGSVGSFASELINHNYSQVSKSLTSPFYEGETVIIDTASNFTAINGASVADDNYGYGQNVIEMGTHDVGVIKVNAPEAGRYCISMDYLDVGDNVLAIEMSMKINGEYQFYELRSLRLEALWQDPEEDSFDRYGNQIVPVPRKVREWQNKYICDSSYRYSGPLAVELKQGINELEISVTEGSFLFGNIYLCEEPVIAAYTGSQKAPGDLLIQIQAEDMYSKNASSIRAACEFDVDLDPYKIESKVLNTLDASSFSTAGMSVTYQVKVEKAGIYHLAMNYIQTGKTDFPVFVNVEIDGEIPNTEFYNYPLNYNTSYQVERFSDDEGNELSLNLSEGEHTITITLAADPIRSVLEQVDVIMHGVNNLNLEITKVAGSNKDKYRDLDILRYIPDVITRLEDYADTLDALVAEMQQYNPKARKIGAFASASIASKQLRSLASEPENLAYRVSELTSSGSSINQVLATLLTSIDKHALGIDRIYLYQDDAKIPKGKGFFASISASIKRFVNSFTSQAYSTGNTDPEHLQVWVNRSRQYVEIMQKMVDEEFTPQTGIVVDLSLMPDQNKLVLANASGDAPDVATGIGYTSPFELGIRGAIKDLTEFEDFVQVAERFEEGLLIPVMIEDGIYALPETMNFWVLFVRTDVFEKLGLEVPDTIQDVKNMLPSLQMRGMNFYYPTAGMGGTRGFAGTMPLIMQMGGSLYTEYAGDSNMTSEESVAGFKELTELFTIYNLPKDVSNFYQRFKNGTMPVGIGDLGIYNMLLNAAPEIANCWEIYLVPGMENEDGEVLRYSFGGAETTVIFRSDEEREAEAWEFMKWWSSADVQTEFGQTLQVTYGSTFLWNTANTEAFARLPWKTQDKEVILAQSEWINEVPRVPGSYMAEREISNAYNGVVVNGQNLRRTLDSAVKRMNHETERKLEEFGYNDENGNVIKPYKVPTLERVREILGR